jgi:hypothetical protein
VILKQSKVRKVRGITCDQEDAIKAFMQGAVYCWIVNRPKEWFAARNLVGGVNFDWDKTPIYVLYQKYYRQGAGKNNKDAIKAAGRDLGWLLKSVFNADKRDFDSKYEERTNKYLWIP